MSKILETFGSRRGSAAAGNAEEKLAAARSANKEATKASLSRVFGNRQQPGEPVVKAITDMGDGAHKTKTAGARNTHFNGINYNPVPLALIAMPNDQAPTVDTEEATTYTDEQLIELVNYFLDCEDEEESDAILEALTEEELDRFQRILDAAQPEEES